MISKEIIFVLARTTGGKLPESYSDYYRMIEMSGFRTCELAEIDYQSENVYIWSSHIGNPSQVFNHDKARERKCKLVNWWLEWPKWENGILTGWEGLEEPVDEVWVSDFYLYALAKEFKGHAADKYRFIVMGGHPDFGDPDYQSRRFEWDFCHLSYVTGVRGQKMEILRQHGFSFAPNGWGEQREVSLRSSRWGLHLHQTPLPTIAPQRFLLFASYGLPIVSDYCADPTPFAVFQDAMIHFDPRLSSLMNRRLRDEAIKYNYNLITKERTFRKEVERLVEAMG